VNSNQPKKVPVPHVSGYPETGIGMDDVQVKGKYMAGTGKKQYHTVRGAGAARKGKRFLAT
jgi:hypothetical protein